MGIPILGIKNSYNQGSYNHPQNQQPPQKKQKAVL